MQFNRYSSLNASLISQCIYVGLGVCYINGYGSLVLSTTFSAGVNGRSTSAVSHVDCHSFSYDCALSFAAAINGTKITAGNVHFYLTVDIGGFVVVGTPSACIQSATIARHIRLIHGDLHISRNIGTTFGRSNTAAVECNSSGRYLKRIGRQLCTAIYFCIIV